MTQKLLSTKEVAKFLGINEKMVYSLVSEKGLPATKVTGKWLFPQQLVDQWIESRTINYPKSKEKLPAQEGLVIVAGSNDPLLDATLSLFNSLSGDQAAVFGNMGSLGGLRALRRNLCHIASSHLLQDNETEYNFDFANAELEQIPAVVNFCLREQGLLITKDNLNRISSISDLGKSGIRIANRPLGTGTRLLFDRELAKSGLSGESIEGYQKEYHRHLDIGLEVLSGRADAGPGIRAVAGILDLEFIPLRWERFDFMIAKECFFGEGVQRFLGLLHDNSFKELANRFAGYDLKLTGRMVFPEDNMEPEGKEKAE